MTKDTKKKAVAPLKLGQDLPNPLPYRRWPREYESPYAWTEHVATWATRLKDTSEQLGMAHITGNEAELAKAVGEYKEARDGLFNATTASDVSNSNPNIIAAQTLATQTMLAHVLFNLQAISPETAKAVSVGLAQAADELKIAHEGGTGIAKEAQATVDAFIGAFDLARLGKGTKSDDR